MWCHVTPLDISKTLINRKIKQKNINLPFQSWVLILTPVCSISCICKFCLFTWRKPCKQFENSFLSSAFLHLLRMFKKYFRYISSELSFLYPWILEYSKINILKGFLFKFQLWYNGRSVLQGLRSLVWQYLQLLLSF